jgi:hypothetical protein
MSHTREGSCCCWTCYLSLLSLLSLSFLSLCLLCFVVILIPISTLQAVAHRVLHNESTRSYEHSPDQKFGTRIPVNLWVSMASSLPSGYGNPIPVPVPGPRHTCDWKPMVLPVDRSTAHIKLWNQCVYSKSSTIIHDHSPNICDQFLLMFNQISAIFSIFVTFQALSDVFDDCAHFESLSATSRHSQNIIDIFSWMSQLFASFFAVFQPFLSFFDFFFFFSHYWYHSYMPPDTIMHVISPFRA